MVQARLKKSGAWWLKENAEKMLIVAGLSGKWRMEIILATASSSSCLSLQFACITFDYTHPWQQFRGTCTNGHRAKKVR